MGAGGNVLGLSSVALPGYQQETGWEVVHPYEMGAAGIGFTVYITAPGSLLFPF